MIDQYTQSKIKELEQIIDVMSQRQKDINKELSGDFDRDYKNKIDQERQHNSTALRIMFWIKKVLKGEPFEKRLKSDKEYPLWFHHYISCEIRDTLAETLNLPREYYMSMYCRYYIGASQKSIYRHICNYLFPEKQPGIFGFQSEEDLMNDVWRITFQELPQKEWQRFKELRGY